MTVVSPVLFKAVWNIWTVRHVPNKMSYLIDIDCYAENKTRGISDVLTRCDTFKQHIWNIFQWSITDEFRTAMGEPSQSRELSGGIETFSLPVTDRGTTGGNRARSKSSTLHWREQTAAKCRFVTVVRRSVFESGPFRLRILPAVSLYTPARTRTGMATVRSARIH